MDKVLLLAKFQPPPVCIDIVHRPRLRDILDSSLQRKITLITAPAGYGKTSLLCEWLENSLKKTGLMYGWFSVDKDDDLPPVFLWNLTRALQSAVPQIGASIEPILEENARPASVKQVMTVLLNGLLQSEKEFVLILDDYHWVESREIQDGMAFLIEHLPVSVHLIVATRRNPPWPLARWRANQDLVEISQQRLGFKPEEIDLFLQHAINKYLPPDEIAALAQQLEGWPAGLRLASLSMKDQGTVNPDCPGNRQISDYLLEEVLNQQDEKVRGFLIKTAVLRQLSAPVCDFILEIEDSSGILGELERDNLFITPLDSQLGWFRYHALFADFLLNQLTREHPGLPGELHRRASRWYQAHGSLVDAIYHALQAGDADRAADLVGENALEFIAHGELAVVMRWLAMIPEDVIHQRPWLCIAMSWALAYSGNPQAVENLLAYVHLNPEDMDPQSSHILGHIYAIQAYLAMFDGNFSAVIENGSQALAILPDEDSHTRISTMITLAVVERHLGHFTEAGRLIDAAIPLSRISKNSLTTVNLICAQAAIFQMQGQVDRAIDSLRYAILLATLKTEDGSPRELPWAGQPYIRLGRIYMNRYELDTALDYTRKGIALSEQWGHASGIWEGYRNLSLILIDLGEKKQSRAAIRQAELVAQQISGTLTTQYTLVYQTHKCLLDGNLAGAAACIRKLDLSLPERIQLFEYDLYAVWAYTLIVQGKPRQAVEILNKLEDCVLEAGAVTLQISTAIFLALAYQRLDEIVNAMASLESAVELAKPIRHLKDFVDDGKTLRPLLSQLLIEKGGEEAFITTILSFIDRRWGVENPDELIDPLSRREQEVLRLLGTSLDSDGIAKRLGIATSTVRTHIRNIYKKMGVSRRMEAIERARELGAV